VERPEDFDKALTNGLHASPVHEVLVEQSVMGWKEYELELLRDGAGNFIIICSIENFDPMGIHTGDSITVAPAMTLPDTLYQKMRDLAILMMDGIGKFAGGCNVQFSVNPETDDIIAIEINPRVSRSSALASKATGYPIAKIAAKMAIGYNLDELINPITGSTSAFFEPAIDYVIVKVPRWNFDKFPGADRSLGLQMKSVGEAMGIGRNFQEALQKACQSLEIRRNGLGADGKELTDRAALTESLQHPSWNRMFHIYDAFKAGMSFRTIQKLTKIDPWFLHQIEELVDLEREIQKYDLDDLPPELLRTAKQKGYADRQLAHLLQVRESKVYDYRQKHNIRRVYKCVDTCAAEFEAKTPYYYSTFNNEVPITTDRPEPVSDLPGNESVVSNRKKVVVLGSGPNRIGQGIEFDYSCVHGVLAARESGYETIMINCNPETVSTDYDTSDRLYFEPLTAEDVLEILNVEQSRGTLHGVIVQFGGQTPLNLALDLERHGVPILGTSPDAIDLAEDRERFAALVGLGEIEFEPRTPDAEGRPLERQPVGQAVIVDRHRRAGCQHGEQSRSERPHSERVARAGEGRAVIELRSAIAVIVPGIAIVILGEGRVGEIVCRDRRRGAFGRRRGRRFARRREAAAQGTHGDCRVVFGRGGWRGRIGRAPVADRGALGARFRRGGRFGSGCRRRTLHRGLRGSGLRRRLGLRSRLRGRRCRHCRQIEFGGILEPAVLALGATHGPPFATDGSIGHRVAGAAGWTGDNHTTICNSLQACAHKRQHASGPHLPAVFHIAGRKSAFPRPSGGLRLSRYGLRC